VEGKHVYKSNEIVDGRAVSATMAQDGRNVSIVLPFHGLMHLVGVVMID